MRASVVFQFRLPKGVLIFQIFSKEFFILLIFQLCLTFSNFKNIWAILENLKEHSKV